MAFLLIVMSFPVTSDTSQTDVIAHTMEKYLGIVAGLPWKFKLSVSVAHNEPSKSDHSTSYKFKSINPLKKTKQGALYLKADFTVIRFESSELATKYLLKIQSGADLDMGLSYGWDYLFLKGQVLYRLHVNCMMSEVYFDTMVDNLRMVVQIEGKGDSKALRCRCGGGCHSVFRMY